MEKKEVAIISAASLLIGLGLGSILKIKSTSSSSDQIKTNVKNSYRKVAQNSKKENFGVACCGVGTACCPDEKEDTSKKETQYKCGEIMCESYENISGYDKDADLAQGCGIPTQFAGIRKGDVVLDLGSGAGIDCFVAREQCGPEGKVIGLDFTEEMIRKAQLTSDKNGYRNVEFRFGDIEDMPILDNSVNVVISNCVINLCSDKKQAYKEIFRVLKSQGHFSISDIVIEGELPGKLRKAAEVYSACIGGALNINDQLQIVKDIGFSEPEIKKRKVIDIPDDVLLRYLSKKELQAFRDSKTLILSITLVAQKP